MESLLEVLRKSIRERADSSAELFIAKIIVLPEPGMRSKAVTEKLRALDSELSLALLSGLLQRSLERDPRAQQLLLDLCTARPLASVLGYQTSRRIYELARLRRLDRVTQLFLYSESESARTIDAAFLERENDKLPDESLGWRKSNARSGDRLKLDRLLFDRNPAVIRLLLQNPRIIERDVVKIAAMRPANPACLHEVFANQRWLRRYRVKVALACNPYTPVDIALGCVPHLMAPKLKYLSKNSATHPTIRALAIDILSLRGLLDDPATQPAATPGETRPNARFHIDVDRIARELHEWRADQSDTRQDPSEG